MKCHLIKCPKINRPNYVIGLDVYCFHLGKPKIHFNLEVLLNNRNVLRLKIHFNSKLKIFKLYLCLIAQTNRRSNMLDLVGRDDGFGHSLHRPRGPPLDKLFGYARTNWTPNLWPEDIGLGGGTSYHGPRIRRGLAHHSYTLLVLLLDRGLLLSI